MAVNIEDMKQYLESGYAAGDGERPTQTAPILTQSTPALVPAPKPTGEKKVANHEQNAASVIRAYGNAITSAMELNKHRNWSRQRAKTYVNRTQPELHRQYQLALTGRAGIDRPRIK